MIKKKNHTKRCIKISLYNSEKINKSNLNLDDVKVLATRILLSDHFNKYFSLRQLRDKIIVDIFNVPERYLFSESEYTPFQKRLGKQLNHCFREFEEKEWIKKYSCRFWILNRTKIKKDMENE